MTPNTPDTIQISDSKTTEIVLKSTIDVEYVDHMGSDLRCVEAMLVSTRGSNYKLSDKEKSPEGIRGRLKFLMMNRHGTPFECGAMTVRVNAPIKVWREWHRHRVGFSYNEESGRYKDLEPVFWLPPRTRPMIRPEGFKSSRPAFDHATDEEYDILVKEFTEQSRQEYASYQRLLAAQFDRGLARDVLGVFIFSACYVTANPRSIMHFLELRTKKIPEEAKRPSNPLWEIDNAAQQLETLFAAYWPITHSLWCEYGRMAP